MTTPQPIFISYRQRESTKEAASLRHAIESVLGPGTVFIDAKLELGERFPDKIRQAAEGCRVMLVVIGPRWLGKSEDGSDLPRIQQDADWVRFEVRIALEGGKKVIPVLLDDTPLPATGDLPADLSILPELQAERLLTTDFHYSLDRIKDKLGRLRELADIRPEQHAVTPELEPHYWREIVESTDPAAFRGFLARFPAGVMVTFARERLQKLEWERVSKTEDAAERQLALNTFLAEFNSGALADAARGLLAQTRESLAAIVWRSIARTTRAADLQRFQEDWGDTCYSAGAMERADVLRREQEQWRTLERHGQPAAIREFLKHFPDGAYRDTARERLAVLAWQDVSKSYDPDRLEAFARDAAGSSYAAQALSRAKALREIEQSWSAACKSPSISTVQNFRSRYPGSHRDAEAHALETMLIAEADAWSTVKDSRRASALKDFLRRFPSGASTRAAQERIDRLVREEDADWEAAKNSREDKRLADYVAAWLEPRHIHDALDLRRELESSSLKWVLLRTKDDTKAVDEFVRNRTWPRHLDDEVNAKHRDLVQVGERALRSEREKNEIRLQVEAIRRQQQAELTGIKSAGNPARLAEFMSTATDPEVRGLARQLAQRWDSEEGRWQQIKEEKDPRIFEQFLKQFPDGRYAEQARAAFERRSRRGFLGLFTLLCALAAGPGPGAIDDPLRSCPRACAHHHSTTMPS